jgi:hypothetical protein
MLAAPQISLAAGQKPLLCSGARLNLSVPYNSAYSYQWSSNLGTSYIASVGTPGSYTVTISDRNGCQATSAPIVITAAPVTSSDFTFADNSPVNTPVVFTPVVTDAASYSWYIETVPEGSTSAFPPPMTVQSTMVSPSVTYQAGGVFEAILSVTDSNGCMSTSFHDVNVVGGCPTGSITYYASRKPQKFVVPPCATSVTIDAYGGEGGYGGAKTKTVDAALGGKGGEAKGTLAVTPGDILNVFVGSNGVVTPYNVTGSDTGVVYPPTAGGYNGGGAVNQDAIAFGVGMLQWSGSGGGASDVRVGGMDLANRVIVAAGGGGGGSTGQPGGAGGGLTGLPGTGLGAGGGGTQTAGGAAGPGVATRVLPGALGVGGDTYRGTTYGAGAGGGGYYGGGGGNYAGGGGGSSYIGGVTNGSTVPGVQLGPGLVIISW